MSRYFQLAMLAMLGATSMLSADYCGCLGGWKVSAEWLVLKASVDDTYFVIESPVDSFVPNGTRRNNDPEFDSGFRLTATFDLCDGCRQLYTAYTRFATQQHRHVAGGFLFATVGPPDLIAEFEDYDGTADSTLNLMYQRFDTLLVQQACSFCGFDLTFQMGFEYAYLRLSEHYAYDGDNGEGPLQASVFEKTHTSGFGPQVGLGLNYYILDGWGECPGSLYFTASGSGSLLVASTKIHANSFIDVETLTNVTDEATWRLIPALHAKFGFNFDTCLCGYDSTFGVNYEISSYVRGLSRTIYGDDVGDSLISNNYYNFDVQGLSITAGVNF